MTRLLLSYTFFVTLVFMSQEMWAYRQHECLRSQRVYVEMDPMTRRVPPPSSNTSFGDTWRACLHDNVARFFESSLMILHVWRKWLRMHESMDVDMPSKSVLVWQIQASDPRRIKESDCQDIGQVLLHDTMEDRIPEQEWIQDPPGGFGQEDAVWAHIGVYQNTSHLIHVDCYQSSSWYRLGLIFTAKTSTATTTAGLRCCCCCCCRTGVLSPPAGSGWKNLHLLDLIRFLFTLL